jgi:prevent-host-death family protein
MCYMGQNQVAQPDAAVRPHRPERVGVRELRQNLSIYLERVIAGERLEVTDRGNPVAMLIPIRPGATLVERLVADGRAIPATRDATAPSVLPPVEITDELRRRIWEAFEESREDRL